MQTAGGYSMSSSLIEEIRQSLERNSDKTAVEEGGIRRSYKELKEAVYFLTHLLNKNHCQTAAVIGEPSFLTIASVLSVTLSEAVYIPIDPSWPLKRIKKTLQHSGADTALSYTATLNKYSIDFKDLNLPQFFRLKPADAAVRQPADAPVRQPDLKQSFSLDEKSRERSIPINMKAVKTASPDGEPNKYFLAEKYAYSKMEAIYSSKDIHPSFASPKKTNSSLAYIMYTSGSSGEPKGVKVPFRSLKKFLHWVKEEFQISSHDRFSYTASLGFGASIRQIFSPALSGAQTVCFPPETVRSPPAFLKELKRQKITVLNAPPIVLQQLAEQAVREKADKHFLKSVRLALAGGDLFPKDILDFWYEQFKHPHLAVNLYGSTESIVNASGYKTSDKKRGPASHKLLPIGQPRPGFSFLLKDEQGEIIKKAEAAGELYIQSAFLASGYHKNKEESEKTFSLAPKTNEALYKTGDRALRLPSQDYLVLGRGDSQVQIYGQRLELGEIENSLNSHPQVKRAFVIHFKAGHFDKIKAYIQPADKRRFDEKALRDFLSEDLPSYMIPHEFQQISRPPITGSNKVDYAKLKEAVRLAEERKTSRSDAKRSLSPKEKFYESSAPINISLLSDKELSGEIKKIWKKYIGEKKFANHQSFFDCGGDSVLAVGLYQSLCEKFSVPLDPYIFYTSPTISNIVKALRQAQNPTKQTAAQKEKAEIRPALKASSLLDLKRLWMNLFLKALKLSYKIMALLYTKKSLKRGPQSPQQKSFVFMKQIFNETYNGLFSAPAHKPVNKEEFKRALQLVIRSQESLRTVFAGDEQIVLPDYPPDILFYDLKNQTNESQQNTIKKTEDKLLRESFSFSALPLFKLAVFELSKTRFHLIFCISHIVGDGWSLQAFLSELNKSYSSLKKDGPALPSYSYLDYTKKYKAFCRQNFAASQNFWSGKMAKISEYNQSAKCESLDPLFSEESLKLNKLFADKAASRAKKRHTREFYIYLALWAESLKEFLACSKICFWTTYHGRSFPFKGLNSMIGSIARAAPLFMDLRAGDKTELLRVAQTAYLDSLKHADFNIAKAFLFSKGKASALNNWIGFNYLDFKPLPQLTKDLPFIIDFNRGEVRLSSGEKSYKRLYLFFSIHSYRDHVELKMYGKASKEHKRRLLQLMKDKLAELPIDNGVF